MAEVWFYHLERKGVDEELPGLLQRGLERGLRLSVMTTSPERVKELSQKLWAREETAFMPHGYDGEPAPDRQPIFIATGNTPPNGATFRFFIDGAAPDRLEGTDRAIIMFDGNNDAAVQEARTHWRTLKPMADAIKYWKQDAEGRWRDQAAG